MRKYVLLMLVVISTFACNYNDDKDITKADDSQVADQEELQSIILEIISATVEEIESDSEGGRDAWKVTARNEDGVTLEFYFTKSANELLRVDGEEGPFTYDVVPGNGAVDFLDAKSTGDEAADGSLDKWRLRTESGNTEKWVYELDYQNPSARVAIDGNNGNLMSSDVGDNSDNGNEDNSGDNGDYGSGGSDY